jgi:hypothetical protein
MNRRQFAGSVFGTASLLVAGRSLMPAAAFGKTKDDRPDSTASDDSEDLTDNVVSSLKRVYDREDPMSFVVAIGLEMDRKRNASTMYENLLAGGVTFFGEIDFEDEFDYGELADEGHVYTGIIDLGEDAPPVYVAVLYAQAGKNAYAIGAGDLEDPMPILDDYYAALFDEDREKSELLLTKAEMPRGFVISEETDAFDDEPSKDNTDEDAPKKRSGNLPHDLVSAVQLPMLSLATRR